MRADVWLVQAGHFASRTAAQNAIAEGKVTVDGKPIRRPAEPIEGDAHAVAVADPMPYVSRGGLKLAGALDAFALDVRDLRAIDIGASTGGFTDVLLKRGAAHVTALDAGVDQLHPTLRSDPRVLTLEHCNARDLASCPIAPPYDIAVMDVSFISQTYILPGIAQILAPDGVAVTLIKPQFEAGREALGHGGIVRREADRMAAILRVLRCAAEHGLAVQGLIRSPIDGGDGNREYLVHLIRRDASCAIPDSAAVKRLLGASPL